MISQDVRDKIVIERERLFDALTTFEFLEPFPSESNFILCRYVNFSLIRFP
jgi:histidinol-phosphate aminotransferase